MDFTKWEKLINNIPLKDLWVPHDVVEQFLDEVYSIDDPDYCKGYYWDMCFQECGLCEHEDVLWEFEHQDQDKEYKRMFSKITKGDFDNSPFLYLTTDGYVIPFTYECFKQLIKELKELIND